MKARQTTNSRAPLLAQGVVRHQRFRPFGFYFSYRVHLLGSWHENDHQEPKKIPGLLGTSASWRRKDFLPQHPGSLRQAAFQEALQRSPRPAERVLHFGTWRQGLFHFNPVCFYLLFDGDHLIGVLSEITNTPWRQRRCYWVPNTEDSPLPASQQQTAHRTFQKDFHISPFNPLDQQYRWSFNFSKNTGKKPCNLAVAMTIHEQGHKHFYASLALAGQPVTRPTWHKACLSAPISALSTLYRIYHQAWRLHKKGAPFYPNPHSENSKIISFPTEAPA